MSPKSRIERLRATIAERGERSEHAIDQSALGQHRDFENFSENTGPGDREPSFTDFANSNS